ncbi:hypothetical protein BJ165DRAFT_635740 [Panaeolus papilionaceus]|nr:hypothetical protein BJ165DRAFT_635740 [Panaeolus papilionaceus]
MSSSSPSSSSFSLTRPSSSLRPALKLLLTLQTLSLLISRTQARQNFTLDDNDPLIMYSPSGGGWTEIENPLDAGGSHMVTLDSSSLATFTFTGVYIEFWSALWPTILSASLSLDGAPAVRVDLQDHNSPVDDTGGETVQSSPVWNSGELENGEHTLIIGTWAGENVTVVDTLV